VQGRLRKESLSCEIATECACCGRAISITMHHDLSYRVSEPEVRPLFFVPIVDFTRLEAPSIVDDF
jgi:hypothetical protein